MARNGYVLLYSRGFVLGCSAGIGSILLSTLHFGLVGSFGDSWKPWVPAITWLILPLISAFLRGPFSGTLLVSASCPTAIMILIWVCGFRYQIEKYLVVYIYSISIVSYFTFLFYLFKSFRISDVAYKNNKNINLFLSVSILLSIILLFRS